MKRILFVSGAGSAADESARRLLNIRIPMRKRALESLVG